jgi:hypothetical protein
MSLNHILEEFEKYKGQLVIVDFGWKVERLVAIGDDEFDYYYITYDGRELNWHTCVGSYIPLKGFIRNEDYNRMVFITRLNHYDQVDLEQNGNMDNFLLVIKEYVAKYDPKSKFITELCWDLKPADIKDVRKRKIENINEL